MNIDNIEVGQWYEIKFGAERRKGKALNKSSYFKLVIMDVHELGTEPVPAQNVVRRTTPP